MLSKKTALCVTLGLLISAVASAQRPVPDKQFSCQVVTASGVNGVVDIATFSRDRAMKNVIGLNAVTLAGRLEPAVSVVQCIKQRSQERFGDSYFQKFVDGLEG